jgi:hypothetical protein
MADCETIMARYKAGKTVYCGIVLSAWKAGIPLLEKYRFALWRVDVNWPWGDNEYLRGVANELLSEACDDAQAKLGETIAQTEKTLAELKEGL